MPQIITFVVSGQESLQRGAPLRAAATSTPLPGRIKHAVHLGRTRSTTQEVRVEAIVDEEIVVLQLEDGPTLILHPNTARALIQQQSTALRSKQVVDEDTVIVPDELHADGTVRGKSASASISSLYILTDVAWDPVANFVVSRAVRQIDAQVDEGLYLLKPDFSSPLKQSGIKLTRFPSSAEGRPLLILIHGTFSETKGTFGKLWERHQPLVKSLFDHYANHVYALEHPTLGVSPINNALLLVNAVPKRAKLHLLTHSRGGLVAEILARLCADPILTKHDLEFFADERYRSHRNELEELAARIREKQISVERIVRVACPVRGTLLADRRLDLYVSLLNWTLRMAGISVLPELVSFLGEVARRRVDPEILPGLEAQMPENPLIRWLHAYDQSIPGQLRIIAGDVDGDSLVSWIKASLANAYFQTSNDFVVHTEAMYGGMKRQESASFLRDEGGAVSHFKYFANQRTATAITAALIEHIPADFRPVGQRSWEGKDPSGFRGWREEDRMADPGKVESKNAALPSPLQITVINGNVRFVRGPLLLGHYRSTSLTGTERIIDQSLHGTLVKSLVIGNYPQRPGAYQVFTNSQNDAATRSQKVVPPMGPEAVIIVGLGQEGKLSATEHILSVRQAVIAWVRHLSSAANATRDPITITATLLGSGGAGISAAQAARAIAEGVHEANLRLHQNEWPYVGHLRIIEVYLDRATEAWHALHVMSTAAPDYYNVAKTVQSGIGPLRRPLDSSYRGASYDLIRAVTQADAQGRRMIAYTLDTKRARAEVRAQHTQDKLLRELTLTAPEKQKEAQEIGHTLFQLVVPVEMEPFLGGTMEMQIELDRGTAGIPWELLDTPSGTRDGADQRPWAVRTKLLRRLLSADFRKEVFDADKKAHVLVIGEPACDTKQYPRLPGAREEANAVAASFRARLGNDSVRELISCEGSQAHVDARSVITTLLERDWRIIHIAGHGELPQTNQAATDGNGNPNFHSADPHGVVLSNGIFLGPREIETMREVPELVFINCCHLASRRHADLQDQSISLPHDFPGFAATVAESLIRIGVRCVIAAGWAVDDTAAKVFATTFYERLFDGERFIDAVYNAREKTWEQFHDENTTWAAYQCYGDPNWMLNANARAPTQSEMTHKEEFASVSSALALIVALEEIIVHTKIERKNSDAQFEKIKYLRDVFESEWGTVGVVAEAFGLAFAAVGKFDDAVTWLERARDCEDGTASLKASEQLAKVYVQAARENVEREMQSTQHAAYRESRIWHAKHVQPTLEKMINDADKRIEKALTLLEKLQKLRETVERHSLRAYAYKRRSMLHALRGNAEAEQNAIKSMLKECEAAEKLADPQGNTRLCYPPINRIAAEVALHAGMTKRPNTHAQTLAGIREYLKEKNNEYPSFRTIVGLVELDLYESLFDKNLSRSLDDVQEKLEQVYGYDADRRKWSSVRDNIWFVLSKYIKESSSDAEKDAADKLLKQLEVYAGAACFLPISPADPKVVPPSAAQHDSNKNIYKPTEIMPNLFGHRPRETRRQIH